MKGIESNSNGSSVKNARATVTVGHTGRHRSTSYQRVYDERKRPLRGLWIRNGRYYAQITLEDPHTGVKQVRRIPLEEATTPAQAREALSELKHSRRKGETIVQRRAPKFADFAADYMEHHKLAKDTKRASTMATEGHAINRLKERIGHLALDKINLSQIRHFIAHRQSAGGVSARTVNLEITVLRNVLNMAIDRKFINKLPTENLRPLKVKKIDRKLKPIEAIEKLCAVAFEARFCNGRLAKPGEKAHPLLNAEQFADYIRLMCFAGSRMAESLRLRWDDVDWAKRQLTIGADGLAKNGKSRAVDFNDKLETHLRDMQSRRLPGTQWLFPSPRSGETDAPARTFRESLRLARQAADLPGFGFHDLRHSYISYCIMAGIDFMTIARWVGHQDGGILIGRVYGHIANEHAQRQAKKLQF